MTSKADIARSLVRLSLLAAKDPVSVPDQIRLHGDAKSYKEIAEIMSRECGETIKVSEENADEFLANIGEEHREPASLIR